MSQPLHITALLLMLLPTLAQGQPAGPSEHRSISRALFETTTPATFQPFDPANDVAIAPRGLLQSLDFEMAEILSGLDLHDLKANQTHECNLKGYEHERSREITSAEQFSGRQSIAYSVEKTRGLGPPITKSLDYFGNGTDKIHHWIVPYERVQDSLVEFGTPCYVGFAFKIDRQSELPITGNGVIIFQMWQGAPFCPPLKVHLVNTENAFHLAVSARNNITGSNPSACWETIQKGVPVAKDRWYRCVVKTVFRHHNMANPGEVQVWMAEDRSALQQTASWSGSIGYDPASKGNYNGRTDVPHPRSNLVPTFGIYRERQPRLLKLYFDSVCYATQFAWADPISMEMDASMVSAIVPNDDTTAG